MSGLASEIRAGALARAGLLSDDQQRAAVEFVARVEAEGVETVRLVFADQHGILRGKTIVADRLGAMFKTGLRVPSTLLLKDTSHRTVFPVWAEGGDVPMGGASDVVLVPLPETFTPVPWSPHSGLIHCDVALPDGAPVGFAARRVLGAAVEALADQGLRAVMGLEVEFQVFELVDPGLDHGAATMPPRAPETRNLTQGWQFLTETRYGQAEPLLDDLRRAAQAMGMPVQSVEIEFGPSQFEFTFAPSDPLTIAEWAVNFRTLVKALCQSRGLHASFMAKPRLANAAANGWHVHQSVEEIASGRNLMVPETDGALSETAGHWVAGLLEHAKASCVLTNPTVNGYKRFTPYQLAPNRIGWGFDNRGAMVRVLAAPGDGASRVENRVPDSSANPYFALAGQVLSGLDGVRKGLAAPEALSSPYDSGAELLPTDLGSALAAFEESEMYRAALGDGFVDYLVTLKRAEWQRYLATISEWEQDEYFGAF